MPKNLLVKKLEFQGYNVWHCLHDPAFNRFGTIQACEDGRTGARRQHIPRYHSVVR